MLNFSHTYLYFKDLIRTYFCGIYVILWDLIEDKRHVFNSLKIGPGLLPVDRRAQTCTVVGLVGQRALLSGNGPGRPTESCCSLYPVPVDRAVDRWHNGHKNDRWPVDRRGNFALVCCQRADLVWGYIYPIPLAVLTKFFKSKKFSFFQCLIQVFKRVFRAKRLIFIYFKKG